MATLIKVDRSEKTVQPQRESFSFDELQKLVGQQIDKISLSDDLSKEDWLKFILGPAWCPSGFLTNPPISPVKIMIEGFPK